MKKTPGRPVKISYALKAEIAKAYLETDQTSTEVGKKYGISDNYVRILSRRYKAANEVNLKTPKPLSESEQQEAEALQKRIKELEEKLEFAKLKLEATETMIDVAEEMFNIDIRKKRGSRQQKK